MVENVQPTSESVEGQGQLGTLLLLVDVQNLFYSARNAFGSDARVDFKKISDEALGGRKFKRIIRKAYFAIRPGEKPNAFISALQRLSYEVELVSIRSHEQGGSSATNIDVLLATDALNIRFSGKHPDVVCIASGDSDFLPVYQALIERGVVVEVLSFPASLSTSVEETAHKVVRLNASHLFETYTNTKEEK